MGDGNGEGSIFADEGRMRLEEAGTTLYPICRMSATFEEEEDLGNAKLVSSAPDLLKACEAVMDWAKLPGNHGGLNPCQLQFVRLAEKALRRCSE